MKGRREPTSQSCSLKSTGIDCGTHMLLHHVHISGIHLLMAVYADSVHLGFCERCHNKHECTVVSKEGWLLNIFFFPFFEAGFTFIPRTQFEGPLYSFPQRVASPFTFYGVGSWTLGLVHARQMHYHWAISPVLSFFFWSQFMLYLPVTFTASWRQARQQLSDGQLLHDA